MRLYSAFLKFQIVLILFGQENRGYREVIVGDDPRLIAGSSAVARKDLKVLFRQRNAAAHTIEEGLVELKLWVR